MCDLSGYEQGDASHLRVFAISDPHHDDEAKNNHGITLPNGIDTDGVRTTQHAVARARRAKRQAAAHAPATRAVARALRIRNPAYRGNTIAPQRVAQAR